MPRLKSAERKLKTLRRLRNGMLRCVPRPDELFARSSRKKLSAMYLLVYPIFRLELAISRTRRLMEEATFAADSADWKTTHDNARAYKSRGFLAIATQ